MIPLQVVSSEAESRLGEQMPRLGVQDDLVERETNGKPDLVAAVSPRAIDPGQAGCASVSSIAPGEKQPLRP